MTHDKAKVKAYQRTLGVPEDGVFGPVTFNAYNRYRARLGLPPVPMAIDSAFWREIERLLNPQPALTHPADPNWLVRFGINLALNQMLKGLPVMNFLAGYATVIGGVVSIAIGLAGLAGIHPAGAQSLDFNASIQLIVTGWAALGLRRAIGNIGKP